MNRLEIANAFHENGFNCCQSTLAAFTDRLGIAEETALRLGSGFGSGAGTGELCGALVGAIMALDLNDKSDVTSDAVAAKRRAAARARKLQERFSERFGALRCRDLLRAEKEEPSEAVAQMGLKNHCAIMIASAVELADEMMKEEEA